MKRNTDTQTNMSGMLGRVADVNASFRSSGCAGVCQGFYCFPRGRKRHEEIVDISDFEDFHYSRGDARQDQATAGFLVRDIGGYERSQSHGVDVGNVGEVKDHGLGMFVAHSALEVRSRFDGEGAAEQQDALLVGDARVAFDCQFMRNHGTGL